MKPQLVQSIKIVEDEEVAQWLLLKNEADTPLDLEDLIGEPVLECHWLDDANTYIDVMYSNWDGSEFFAIVNSSGILIRKGIRSIEEYFEQPGLFRVEMSGLGMGGAAFEFDLAPDDWKMAVINQWGEFVIPPEFDSIGFEPEGNYFIAIKGMGKETKFDLKGIKMNGTKK